jgi:hypothetical protein
VGRGVCVSLSASSPPSSRREGEVVRMGGKDSRLSAVAERAGDSGGPTRLGVRAPLSLSHSLFRIAFSPLFLVLGIFLSQEGVGF